MICRIRTPLASEVRPGRKLPLHGLDGWAVLAAGGGVAAVLASGLAACVALGLACVVLVGTGRKTVSGRSAVRAVLLALALGLRVSESEAAEALDEGREIGAVDALMVDADASELQQLDADGGSDFQDDVVQFVLTVASDEALPRVSVSDADGRVLLPDELDDVVRCHVLADAFEDDERTPALCFFSCDVGDGSKLPQGCVPLLDVVELHSDARVADCLDAGWSECFVLEGDRLLPDAEDVLGRLDVVRCGLEDDGWTRHRSLDLWTLLRPDPCSCCCRCCV